MSRNSPPQTVVALAEARATRTLAATQALLLPEADEPLAAEELSRRVAAQLAALPAEERPLLRRKVLVAVHDLRGWWMPCKPSWTAWPTNCARCPPTAAPPPPTAAWRAVPPTTARKGVTPMLPSAP